MARATTCIMIADKSSYKKFKPIDLAIFPFSLTAGRIVASLASLFCVVSQLNRSPFLASRC
jgi:hypothetical protein